MQSEPVTRQSHWSTPSSAKVGSAKPPARFANVGSQSVTCTSASEVVPRSSEGRKPPLTHPCSHDRVVRGVLSQQRNDAALNNDD